MIKLTLHGTRSVCFQSVQRLLPEAAGRCMLSSSPCMSCPLLHVQRLRSALADAEAGGSAAEQQLAAALAKAQQELAVERQRGEMLRVGCLQQKQKLYSWRVAPSASLHGRADVHGMAYAEQVAADPIGSPCFVPPTPAGAGGACRGTGAGDGAHAGGAAAGGAGK